MSNITAARIGEQYASTYNTCELGDTYENPTTKDLYIYLEVESAQAARGWVGYYGPETFKINMIGGITAARTRLRLVSKAVVGCTAVSIGKRGWFQIKGVHASIRKPTVVCEIGTRWIINSISSTVKRRARPIVSGKYSFTARVQGYFLAAGTAGTAAVKGYIGYGG